MFRSRMTLGGLVAALALVLFTVDGADACGWRGCRSYSVGYWVGYTPYWSGYCGDCCGVSACSTCSTCSYVAPVCTTCPTDACSTCAGGTCYSASYWGYPTYYQSYYPTYYPTYFQSYSPSYPVYSPPVYGGCSSCSSIQPNTTAGTIASAPTPTKPAATGRVVFTVTVPSDAKVFVNDRPTATTGTQRSYTAGGLVAGYRYGFTVRTERVVDGRVLSETQTLRLTPGQNAQLTFNLTPSSTQVANQPERPLVKLASRL
jgi:uncharacterized protein (TIGR03000 family)